MHMILTVLAVVLLIAGFVGLFLGVIPSLVAWTLAALCMYFAWKIRPEAQRRREDRLAGGRHAT